MGNVDEVTDVRLVGGAPGAPTHVAVATNGEVSAATVQALPPPSRRAPPPPPLECIRLLAQAAPPACAAVPLLHLQPATALGRRAAHRTLTRR